MSTRLCGSTFIIDWVAAEGSPMPTKQSVFLVQAPGCSWAKSTGGLNLCLGTPLKNKLPGTFDCVRWRCVLSLAEIQTLANSFHVTVTGIQHSSCSDKKMRVMGSSKQGLRRRKEPVLSTEAKHRIIFSGVMSCFQTCRAQKGSERPFGPLELVSFEH